MVQKTVMKNVGTLDNKGWEFELSGRIFQQADFDWDATVRFSQSSSKIKNLGEAGSQILSDALPSSMGYTHKIVNGQEIGKFWLFKYAGLDENGKWLIYDKDNNIVPAAFCTIGGTGAVTEKSMSSTLRLNQSNLPERRPPKNEKSTPTLSSFFSSHLRSGLIVFPS